MGRDVGCAGPSRRFPVGELDRCSGIASPTGDGASHPGAGTEPARGGQVLRPVGQPSGRSVDLSACGGQESCGPKAATDAGMNGTSPPEADKPRNPLHRGRRPASYGGEGSSGRSPRRERPRVRRGLSRQHAGTGSARNPGDPPIGPAVGRGRRRQGNPKPGACVGGEVGHLINLSRHPSLWYVRSSSPAPPGFDALVSPGLGGLPLEQLVS